MRLIFGKDVVHQLPVLGNTCCYWLLPNSQTIVDVPQYPHSALQFVLHVQCTHVAAMVYLVGTGRSEPSTPSYTVYVYTVHVYTAYKLSDTAVSCRQRCVSSQDTNDYTNTVSVSTDALTAR